jgi:hypothetical protein
MKTMTKSEFETVDCPNRGTKLEWTACQPQTSYRKEPYVCGTCRTVARLRTLGWTVEAPRRVESASADD